jgi:hypothetical protein
MSGVTEHQKQVDKLVTLGVIPERNSFTEEIAEMTKRQRPDLRKAPLRAVIERNVLVDVSPKPAEYAMNIPKWKLECGHFVSPPQDIYGERFPSRMRCGECLSESRCTAAESK